MNQSDVDETSTKLLCSYFENLNDVMIDIKSSLKKSNTDHTEVMHKNVQSLQRFLKDGNEIRVQCYMF